MKLTFLNIDAYKLYLNIKIKWNINFKLQNCKPNKLFFFFCSSLVYNAMLENNRNIF